MNCTSTFNGKSKLGSIILNLSKNNANKIIQLSEALQSKRFIDFLKENYPDIDVSNISISNSTELAEFIDSFENFDKDKLEEIVTRFRNREFFNISNTALVAGNGNYGFKNAVVYNDAKIVVADFLYSTYYQEKDDSIRNSLSFKRKAVGKLIKQLSTSLVKLVNTRENTNYKVFDANKRFNTEDVLAALSKIDSKYNDVANNNKDLLIVLLGQTSDGNIIEESNSFMNEIFGSKKIAQLFNNTDLYGTEEDIIDLLDFNEDTYSDSEAIDETSQNTTKQWSEGSEKTNSEKYTGKDTKLYFESLNKYTNTTSPDGRTELGVKRNKSFGLPELHTYNECHNQLYTILLERGGRISMEDFIAALREYAQNVPAFAAFAKVADDMEKDQDLAYMIKMDLAQPLAPRVRVTFNSNGTVTVSQPNYRTNHEINVGNMLVNDLRGTSLTLDHNSNLAKVEALKKKTYKETSNEADVEERNVIETYNDNLFKEKYNTLISLLKSYFPNLDKTGIDSYILNNKRSETEPADKRQNIENLLRDLETVIKNATEASVAQEKNEAKILQKKKELIDENEKLAVLKRAKESQINEQLIPLQEGLEIELQNIIGGTLNAAVNSLARKIATFTETTAAYTSKNILDKQQSDVTANNWITYLSDVFNDETAIRYFINNHFRSNEFKYSNLIREKGETRLALFERDKDGNIYAAKDSNGNNLAPQIFQFYLVDGVNTDDNASAVNYSNMSDKDYFVLSMKSYLDTIKDYVGWNRPEYINKNTGLFILPTPSDAPKNFMIRLPKHSYEASIQAVGNIIRQQIQDYAMAYLEVKTANDRSKLIEFYHYNPKKPETWRNLTGNVFTLNKLISVGEVNPADEIKALIDSYVSLTGEQEINFQSSNKANFDFQLKDESQRKALNAAITNLAKRWVDAYRTSFNERLAPYVETIDVVKENKDNVIDYGVDYYINQVIYDELIRGDINYYKDFKTIVKRDKQAQAGGKQLPLMNIRDEANYNYKLYTLQGVNFDGAYGPKFDENGNQQPLTIRNGFRAITITNTLRGSSNVNGLYKSLLDAGLSKSYAQKVASAFGNITEEDDQGDPMILAPGEMTKTNDAQSYITIWEAARRLKLRGQYPKYAKLISQLTDTTTPLSAIDANELTSFIQVMKHFYFDNYYEEALGKTVSRQIKNAEFVLIPKMLGSYVDSTSKDGSPVKEYVPNTSLGQLLKVMMENDIDQVNTQETSKATNYDVLEFWDKEGYLSDSAYNRFTRDLTEDKIKPFLYAHLYVQQEVPQHIADTKNKAGIQIMKKIFDNLPESMHGLRDDMIANYVANIKESFEDYLDDLGIGYDSNGTIDLGSIDFEKLYASFLNTMAVLGMDSNAIDYLSLVEDEVSRKLGITKMPAEANVIGKKLESVANSKINKKITRQTFNGVHAAQVTSVGLEGYIQEAKSKFAKARETFITEQGKRVELAYHKDKNVVEILLPAWSKKMFGTDITDIDADALEMIGYRIPTEGKQSTAIMKVVGFLPEFMGSSVIVPDEWVIQTGSDFDVDSIYFIVKGTYKDSNGKIHTIKYNDEDSEKAAKRRYANYVLNNLNKEYRTTLREEASLDDEERKEIRKSVAKKLRQEKRYSREEAKSLGDEIIQDEYNENLFDGAKFYAKEFGLKSFDAFAAMSIPEQNGKTARTNRIIDGMIEVLNSNVGTIETLLRSNFEDITSANKIISSIKDDFESSTNTHTPTTYDILDQIMFRRNATGGLSLKGISVAWDTATSVGNMSKAKLREGITVLYGESINEELKEGLKAAYDYNDTTNSVTHNQFGWSRNNKNGTGLYVTVASSHTTAHILDAVKEGSIENENIYTFPAFKLLFSLGVDAHTAILWIRQQGITEVVNSYYNSNSVFSSDNGFVLENAIKNVATKLNLTINKKAINEFTNINDVIKALNNKYAARLEEIFGKDAKISLKTKSSPMYTINVPLMNERYRSSEENNVLKTDEDRLLFDLGMIMNFNNVKQKADKVGNYIRLFTSDKFGAAQTMFETRDFIHRMQRLIKSETKRNGEYEPFMTSAAAESPNTGILQAIYPGVEAMFKSDGTIDYNAYYKANAGKKSVYPHLNAFFKYATITSIVVNQRVFGTEKENFVNTVYELGNILKHNLSKEEYEAYKSYIIGQISQDNNFIKYPVGIDEKGNLTNAVSEFLDGETSESISYNETRRIYGYGVDKKKVYKVADISNPTAEEIEEFRQLTPAQKVNVIKQYLISKDVNLFDYINTDLYVDYIYRLTGDSPQIVRFTDKSISPDIVYNLFNEAFFNTNPLIKLTAIDLIKYAFQVEGFQFRYGNVSKIIANAPLMAESNEGGLEWSGLITNKINGVNSEYVRSHNLAEKFIQSNYDKLNLPVIKRQRKGVSRFFKYNQTAINDPSGSKIYKFDLNNDNNAAMLETLGIYSFTEDRTHHERKIQYFILDDKNYYDADPNTSRKKVRVTQLYKVISGDDIHSLRGNSSFVYLVPLNKLQANEYGDLSVNPLNNRHPSSAWWNAFVIQDNINTKSKDSQENQIPAEMIIYNDIENKYEKVNVTEFLVNNTVAKRTKPRNQKIKLDALQKASENNKKINDFINKINEYFANPNSRSLTIYNNDAELRSFFPTANMTRKTFAVQNFIDDNGTEISYKIARIVTNVKDNNIKNNKDIPKSLEGLNENIYFVVQNKTRRTSVATSGRERVNSAVDMDTMQYDQEAQLAKQQLFDIQHGSNYLNDSQLRDVANQTLKFINRYGVDRSSMESIANHKLDIIREATHYHKTVADYIKRKLSDYDGNGNLAISEEVIEQIKNDVQAQKDYIDFYLQADTFSNSFSLIRNIPIEDLTEDIQSDIRKLREIINEIRNNPDLLKMREIIFRNIYEPLSSNPLITEHIAHLDELILKDANVIDKLFQDAQELSIPIVQIILKQARINAYEKIMQSEEHINDVMGKIRTIMSDAKSSGMPIDINKIVLANGKFNIGYTDKYYEDKKLYRDAVEKARLEHGELSKEFFIANHNFNRWLYENEEQRYIADYYKERLDAEEPMLRPENIDYYLQYRQLKNELYEAIGRFRNSKNAEDLKDINRIKKQISDMTDLYDESMSEKSGEEQRKANVLNGYIQRTFDTNVKYFESTVRGGFAEDLKYYLDIIERKKEYDAAGRQTRTEEDLMQDKDYAEAINWIAENTRYSINKDLADQINKAFNKIAVAKPNSLVQSLLKKHPEAKDKFGVIDGTKFSEDDIAAIKEAQEKAYAVNSKGLKRLIKNANDDTDVYNQEFFDKLDTKKKYSKEVLKEINDVADKINALLIIARDEQTDKIYLNKLNFAQIRKLHNLYDDYKRLKKKGRGITNPGNSYSAGVYVKNFIDANVDIIYDNETINNDYIQIKNTKTPDYISAYNSLMSDYAQDIYGYMKVKPEVRDKYLDKEKMEALKFLRENTYSATTQYWQEAIRKARAEGRLEDFLNKNTVYNPYTKVKEPLKIWTKLELREHLADQKSYVPSWNNKLTVPFADTINRNYVDGRPTWNGRNYNNGIRLNSKEEELRKLMLDEYYAVTAGNVSSYKATKQALFPRRGKPNMSTFDKGVKLLSAMGIGGNTTEDLATINDVGYENDRENNIPMLDYLKAKGYRNLKQIPERIVGEDDATYAARVEQVKKDNEEIIKSNRKIDLANIDRDYISVFEEFLKRAAQVNATESTKIDLYFLLNELRNHTKVLALNGFGNAKIDSGNSLRDNKVYKTELPDNTTKMVETWIKRFLFDEFKSKNFYNNLAGWMQNFASARFMMMNIPGGIANVLTAKYNILQEELAGEYFGVSNWERAKFKQYIPALPAIIRNMNRAESDNLTDAIIKLISVVDFDDISEVSKEFDYNELVTKIRNFAYSPQTAGEHFVQNTAMLALMDDTRLWQDVDGKWILGNFHDYTRKLQFDAMTSILADNEELSELYRQFKTKELNNINKAKDYHWFNKDINAEFLRMLRDIKGKDGKQYAFKYRDAIKNLEERARKEFETKDSMLDQFELRDGFAKIKVGSVMTTRMVAEFKNKAVSVNKKINGIYDKIGAGGIESMWVFGSLVMQYHKHIYMNVMKRYRRNGFWSESRGTRERGYNQDLFDFLTIEFKDFKKRSKNEEGDFEISRAIQTLLQSIVNTFTEFEFNYALATPAQKANMRRMMGTAYTMLAGLALGFSASFALMSMSEDNDDNGLWSFLANLTLYEADDVLTQAQAFSWGLPGESDKLWGNPVAILSSLKDGYNVMGYIAQMIMQGEEFDLYYKNGRYKGENKFKVALLRQLPIYSRVDRLLDIEKNNSYYKLQDNLMSFINMKDIVKWVLQ